MYYKIFIYLYTFTMILSLFLFLQIYYHKRKPPINIPTKTLFRDNIKTGDVFLLDWQRLIIFL